MTDGQSFCIGLIRVAFFPKQTNTNHQGYRRMVMQLGGRAPSNQDDQLCCLLSNPYYDVAKGTAEPSAETIAVIHLGISLIDQIS